MQAKDMTGRCQEVVTIVHGPVRMEELARVVGLDEPPNRVKHGEIKKKEAFA